MEEKRISVLPAHGQNPVAYLTRNDGIENCKIENEVNGSSTLTFSFTQKSDKFQYIQDLKSVFVADGREYTRIGMENSLTTSRDDSNKITYTVTAWETQNLLRAKFTNISNDTLTPNPDGNSVIIVSGGTNLSGGRYTVGSAAHALYALLQGTGWTIGTCDVDGKYDLETEGKSIYENLEEALKLWGGMLFWDSVSKTVSWRSEDKYQPYNGFQIRYGKNLKSLERSESTAIITRLYPYGENKLSIKTYKPSGSTTAYGKEYIDNFSHTNEVIEGVIENNEIREQETLWNWAKEQHKKLCRPQVTYTAKAIDLTAVSNYYDAKPVLGDMADIIDEDIADGNIDRKRIMRLSYDFFRPWDCDIEIGDATGNFLNKFVDLLYISKKADSTINNSGSIHGGSLIENTIPEGSQFPALYRQVSDNKGNISLIVQRADKIETRVQNVEGSISTITQTANNISMRVSNLQDDVASIELSVSKLGSQISMKADKVDLQGLVSIYDLATAGKTTINGANITTGYIDAARIRSGSISVDKIDFNGAGVAWKEMHVITSVTIRPNGTVNGIYGKSIKFLGWIYS